MSRRTIKKVLRRAEDAMREERYADAESIFRYLLDSFEASPPSLLDHAGAIYGLVRALHAQDESDRAIAVAESAARMLESRRAVELAA
jgi:hypothetical protein